jgi:hypothetical protein
MTFLFEITGHGWADISLGCGEQQVVALPSASYLTDVLGSLLGAATALLTEGRGTCAWATEPGTIWWQMSRLGPVARIQVLWLEDDDIWGQDHRGASYSSSDGEVLFDRTCDVVEFGTLVVEAAQRLRHNYTASFRYRYPEDALNRLAAAVKTRLTP